VVNSWLSNCLISSNSAGRSMAYSGNGGGTAGSTLTRCTISWNTANWGGGAYDGILHNCLIYHNQALPVPGSTTSPGYAGGAYNAKLVNCTVVLNSSQGVYGGTALCTLTNSIVYLNAQPQGFEFAPTDTFDHCSTTPLAGGAGNITGGPLFVDLAAGDYHLSPQSPCINTGNNSALSGSDMLDLDGYIRVLDSIVDLGAYEFRPPLLTRFRILSCTPANTSTILTWESVAGARYLIQQSAALAGPSASRWWPQTLPAPRAPPPSPVPTLHPRTLASTELALNNTIAC
jgi:hypothetical protein